MVVRDWWRARSAPSTFAKLAVLMRRPSVERTDPAAGRWLRLPIGVGLLAGAASATLQNLMSGLEPSEIDFRCGLGAVVGGLLGAGFAALLRFLEDRRRRAIEVPGRVDLWDAWLDDGDRDRGAEAVVPARAVVRPRVISPESGGSFCLEDEVLPFVKTGQRGTIRIWGRPGSGKSSALRHLAAVFGHEHEVSILEGPDEATLASRSASELVIYSSDGPARPKHLASFSLAPWGNDELIEYLLGTAASRCGSVMNRLKEADDADLIQGIPELWQVILDRMAADESLSGARQALNRELASHLTDPELRRRVEDYCLAWLTDPLTLDRDSGDERPRGAPLYRLIRHAPSQLLIAAARIVDDLSDEAADCRFLWRRLSRELVREVGLLVREGPELERRLVSFIEGDNPNFHATAASFLHATGKGWRPSLGGRPRLSRAYLDGVNWPEIDLLAIEMEDVSMVGGNLVGAMLDLVKANGARLGRANLRGASLEKAFAMGADLSFANLSKTRGLQACFKRANLEAARLESADLREARFDEANLTRARLGGANLGGSHFEGANIEGADFSGAILESAALRGLPLHRAVFSGARFDNADLIGCNLEGMELPAASFQGARLQQALLTDSIMPRANFRGANLQGAGLAEIQWEGACLANADLRGASFHLGSSRSGLVNSPIASEGTRTGFYTDDFQEQDFKSPEEIRKANLRGADLRGARIEGADFYLVDLRGAIFDHIQAEHLRRCGAILVDRV